MAEDKRPPPRTRKKKLPLTPRPRRGQSVIPAELTLDHPLGEQREQNADLEQPVSRRGEFALLQEIIAIANELPTSDDLLTFALKRICTQIGWAIGQVWSPTPEATDTLTPLPAWYSQDPERYAPFRQVTETIQIRHGVGLPGRVWATGRPAWIPDVSADDHFVRGQQAASVGIHAAFAFPVLVKKHVVAVMEFFTGEVVEANGLLLEEMAHFGTLLGLVVERKHAEATFRGFFEAASDAMILVNYQGNVVLANKQTEQIFGYTDQELLGHSLEILIPQCARGCQSTYRAGSFTAPSLRLLGRGVELTGVRKDKSEFPVEVSLSPLETADGIKVVAAVRDISERKQTEAALRESEDRFRQAFDYAAIGKALVALDGRWIKVNRALCDITGYTEHELLATDFQSITHPEDIDADFTAIQRVLASALHAYEIEKRYVHKRGHVVWVLLSISLVRDAAGAPLYFIAEVQDLTERKRLERQLRERERLATIGTTVAKVAHEIGNPLNGMSATLQVLEGYLTQQPNAPTNLPVGEALHDLKHETNRLRSLLQELHTFARPPELVLRPTNIAAVAAEVLRGVTAYYLERGIGVEQHLSSEVPLVLADEEKLRQVLLNLYKNAAEAMPEGGMLSLHGTHTETEVSLEVQDTGSGISEGVEIFAPFVTTKTQGTGLGLAIVKQIMEAHSGTIAYTSSPGRGTTFRMTFPIAATSEQKDA